MEEREEKWDTRHQDDVLWGNGITDMATRVMAVTEPGQKETGRVDTDSVGLEALKHADRTQTGGLVQHEARQQLQPRLQPKAQPKPKSKSKPAPTPTPRTTSTPTVGMTSSASTLNRRWEIFPP